VRPSMAVKGEAQRQWCIGIVASRQRHDEGAIGDRQGDCARPDDGTSLAAAAAGLGRGDSSRVHESD